MPDKSEVSTCSSLRYVSAVRFIAGWSDIDSAVAGSRNEFCTKMSAVKWKKFSISRMQEALITHQIVLQGWHNRFLLLLLLLLLPVFLSMQPNESLRMKSVERRVWLFSFSNQPLLFTAAFSRLLYLRSTCLGGFLSALPLVLFCVFCRGKMPLMPTSRCYISLQRVTLCGDRSFHFEQRLSLPLTVSPSLILSVYRSPPLFLSWSLQILECRAKVI